MRKFIIAIVMLIPLFGCAAMNRNNTPLFNMSEKYLVPATQPARILSLPLTFPVSLLAITFDATVIHPAKQFGPAYRDTRNIFWTIPAKQWNEEYYLTSFTLPPRAALTPTMYIFDFLGRSLFDVSDTQPVKVDETTSLLKDKYDAAMQKKGTWADFEKTATEVCSKGQPIARAFYCNAVKCMGLFDQRAFFSMGQHACLFEPSSRGGGAAILAKILETGTNDEKSGVLDYVENNVLVWQNIYDNPEVKIAFADIIGGEDPVLAIHAIMVVDSKCYDKKQVRKLFKKVENTKNNVVIFVAKKILEQKR